MSGWVGSGAGAKGLAVREWSGLSMYCIVVLWRGFFSGPEDMGSGRKLHGLLTVNYTVTSAVKYSSRILRSLHRELTLYCSSWIFKRNPGQIQRQNISTNSKPRRSFYALGFRNPPVPTSFPHMFFLVVSSSDCFLHRHCQCYHYLCVSGLLA